MEKPELRHLFLIGVGGVIGALSRYGVDEIFGDIALATFIVNLFGVAGLAGPVGCFEGPLHLVGVGDAL